MIRYRASWILPIAQPPIAGGIVAVERGLVRAIHAAGAADGPPVDLGSVAILPALANAHTHLELSWMQGRVPPGESMPRWAERLIGLRMASEADAPQPIADAIAAAYAAGTGLVGDVTNTFAAYDPLARSPVGGAVFRELLGFNPADADARMAAAEAQIAGLAPAARLRTSIVPHAPYSVSPALFAAIARRTGRGPVSVHLGESRDELEFLRTGTGEWRRLLESVGAWDPTWVPPACGPVEYVRRFGLVGPTLIAVHGVHFTDAELRELAAAGATVVACPRSNRWTGAGTAPIERFYASGVRVAVGTDSLASAEDLNVFAEIAALRRLAPRVPARRLIESATRAGAEALGFDREWGTIEPGKRAALIAVRVPEAVADVEEYLLSGIQPADISWLDPEP